MVNLASLSSGARRPGLKALLVAFLVTLMFAPMQFITMLIEERQHRAEAVTEKVGRIWGGRDQVVAGPFLVVPYETAKHGDGKDRKRDRTQRHFAVVLPEELQIDADILTETRYRSIFEVPVYQAKISVSGRFQPDELASYLDDATRILADEAFLVVNISDARGLRNKVTLSLNGGEHPFRPGSPMDVFGKGGIHAVLRSTVARQRREGSPPADDVEDSTRRSDAQATPVALPGAAPGAPLNFAFDMVLNGSRTLKLLPVGRSTTISLDADWSSPSFSGGFLPAEHEVRADGFTARWEVPDLARNFPQSWRAGNEPEMAAALVGVSLHKGVDFYRKVARSTKYAILFFGFTFLAFFLTELMSAARIHPVQYLMTGAAQVVFYLLLLSLAEHVGFDKAYGAAAVATVLLVTMYGGAAMRSAVFALVLFFVLVAIYALLYSLLQAGDFALLFGSLAAFLGLAMTMLLTRRVDWYGLTRPENA